MRIIHGRGSRQYLLGLLALLAVSSTVWAGVPASPPPSWIHDGANLLKPEELSELTTLREQLEQRTGAQLVVLTLAEAGSESSKTIAVRTLNDWNAGTRSALLLVRLSPRELYIQPGTDLASALDSSISSFICSGVIAPKLRSGDRAGAIRAGLEAIADRITSGSTADTSPLAPQAIPNTQVSHESAASKWLNLDALGPIAALVLIVAFGVGIVVATGVAVFRSMVQGVSSLLGRKCRECGKRMRKSSRVTLTPTSSSPGAGVHTFTCTSCGDSFIESYPIARLGESSSSSSDSTWSSSSDSWSSSSSDSSSSSSSSSDGSGGGGSSW